MQEFKLTFHGKRVDIDDLVEDLKKVDGVEVATLERTSSTPANVLDRDPLNQFELVDAVIAFAINIAAAYTYEEIRAALRKRAEAKGFKEKTPDEGTSDDA